MSSGVGYLGSDLKYKKKTLESKIVGYSGSGYIPNIIYTAVFPFLAHSVQGT